MLSDDLQRRNQDRRKRLGQYFSGNRLARFLFLLADGVGKKAIVDPMCGTGDMLFAAQERSPQSTFEGIEIDGELAIKCRDRVNGNQFNIIQGNAFDWCTVSQLSQYQYDLVITNPPYVRYQALGHDSDGNRPEFPNADSVREGLKDIVKNSPSLDEKERMIFSSLIDNYSGLSDLAVPAWILCAMLTARGGTLGMVVPESWLKRDYASIIHYMLLKLFNIKYIVEDLHRVWFNDAQVKTTLLVAERIPIVENPQEMWKGRNYPFIGLKGSSINDRSIVGNVYPDVPDPDLSFIEDVKKGSSPDGNDSVIIQEVKRSANFSNLLPQIQMKNWFQKLEPAISNTSSGPVIFGYSMPDQLINILPIEYQDRFTSLNSLGWFAGQGLRTGCNVFFYCQFIEKIDHQSLVSFHEAIPIEKTLLPTDCLFPVLRKQLELGDEYQLNENKLNGRVLFLEKYLHPKDYERINAKPLSRSLNNSDRSIMPAELAKLIDFASDVKIGRKGKEKLIPELSAVKTNISRNHHSNHFFPRSWYMLPPFRKRHKPDLFVPRVCGDTPKVRMNTPQRTIIDANFSTFWNIESSQVNEFGMLSMLNSKWIQAVIELSGAVMGGGALKLEATHLRRFPIPSLSIEDWGILSDCGKQLVRGNRVDDAQSLIDNVIISSINDCDTKDVNIKINDIIDNCVRWRCRS